MMLSIDIWQLLGLAGTLLVSMAGVALTLGKWLLGQFERRLDQRFSLQEEIRLATQKHWDSQFSSLEKAAANEAKEWQRIERDILLMKADLPVQYVRRDDYIRNQSIIEAKLDGLAVRIENVFLKGDRHG
ncbi:MAG: hypothetical protein PSU93_09380 [Methylobacter sp.]|uniref:Uncharacterized protein n=1 Tax=Candidatus Methylobacter titanis TaxID=3053457 RepID=A0AA43Q6J6_9GAMM|nr:hypothetical protein [Candidatus Methylobacter titanis]